MSNQYVVALCESLEKKEKVLEEILRICELQRDVLNEEVVSYEEFDRYVDDKDICLEKLEKLDEGFELVYNRVKEVLNADKASYATEIKRMQDSITRITDLSTRIQVQESRNKAEVERRFNMERKDLGQGKRSVSVARNYYKNMSGLSTNPSQFLDKKK